MKVTDIADEIFSDNGEPSDTSVSAIAYWVRASIGQLNSYIYNNLIVDSQTLEIVDSDGNEINPQAAAILKKKWKVERYDYLIRAKLSSLDDDDILEIWDDNSKITRTNRNEVIKALRGLKDAERADFDKLVASYRINGAEPTQVAGDDTQIGVYI